MHQEDFGAAQAATVDEKARAGDWHDRLPPRTAIMAWIMDAS